MALSIIDEGPLSLDLQKALYAPLGAISPLWLLYGGAASAGLAYWWMTRWTDRSHLEAVLGAPALTPEPEAPSPVPPAVTELLTETVEIVEGVTAAAVEAMEEAAEILLEPLVEQAPNPKAKIKPPEEPPPSL